MDVSISYPLAFVAGLVSFLSPCILPVVPSYLAFVSGLTFAELTEDSTEAVRRSAILNSIAFVFGFSVVFMTMGLAATALAGPIASALPWITRAGGIVVIVFGLHLIGLVRIPLLASEHGVEMRTKPQGLLGSLAVGVAFGAGWTPCIGPILGTILLYATMDATAVQGGLLLGTYALGLGIPFVVASAALNWFLAGSQRARRWILPLQRVAGTVLVVIGLLMVTGHFTTLAALLADMGQLINLDVQ